MMTAKEAAEKLYFRLSWYRKFQRENTEKITTAIEDAERRGFNRAVEMLRGPGILQSFSPHSQMWADWLAHRAHELKET